MARRVIVETLCDPCLAQGSEVEAENLPPLPLIGNKPRILALCEEHRKEVYEPLLKMVTDYGQTVDIDGTSATSSKRTGSSRGTGSSPAPSSEPLWCPECEASGTPRSFAAPQGLGAHRYRAHGVESAAKQTAKAG